ncbi:folylpolyglutamate synthase/dihydrofolate synthase family protein [Sphingomonas sp. BIUV-7]|uniref:Dihydrofolate synthase/folylpolyglutamate synthase n=1 Tax=Sphingomonas natans TaxID=3063330 RepID=A0ABT8YC37_9SPHN|nr:folylpolyglutamate synthase/dihydrofolate synthase family protein [Sphingomonas sp. BIUV-7]MDO6415883.1 folylpolyglutamate synthase/dihydrofolate synthase family protein [Sphingomonas sp. BIUV-7]
MADHAVSSDPAVQAQLDRLATLSLGTDILGLERITLLLERLGNPERRLPPVFHVAGTNGKGSTCAFLRAGLEAAGHKVHVYTSPHLVRFNERIRLAGSLIEDALLAELLGEVLDAGGDIGASFFEVTTAAAFLAFARVPADACVVEVGLGGRLDATNAIREPLICGIAQLGLDHQQFLGDRIEDIAAEKAGIAKPGAPLVTLHYPARVAEPVEKAAAAAGTRWLAADREWAVDGSRGRLAYRDADGDLDLPLPRLAGAHQAENAGLAIAMLRHQRALAVPPAALRAAMGWAEWPARLQRLDRGPLPALLAPGSEMWLDGGHNPAAARVIAEYFRLRVAPGRRLHIVLGMLENKDLAGFLEPFAGSTAVIHPVPVAGHTHHDPAAIAAAANKAGLAARGGGDVAAALAAIAAEQDDMPPVVLIAGSLYLAGTVLDANGTPPV